MHIAYSALHPVTQTSHPNETATPQHELLLRYQAYQTICAKYNREIAAIQQYLPGWQPKFY